MSRRFVLLDRDGTIIVEKHYLSDPEAVELIEGAAEGLRRLRAMGLGLAIVTNQSAIGRGYFDRDRLGEIHARLLELLGAEGIAIDGIFFCPHTPDDACACRKPRPGLIEQAAAALDFTPSQSFVVGDMKSDVELGRGVGATTLLVRSGYGARTESEAAASPDHVVDGLDEAASVIERALRASG
jgi:D-glycero-D-manno-heptose 1,7-bisphosphate phosphatase